MAPERTIDDAGALARALEAFPHLSAPVAEPIQAGLIHRSYAVRDGTSEYVLQRVSTIFNPGIHTNLKAVTEHLHARGVRTLRVVSTAGGEAVADLGDAGSWRLLTRVPGVSFEICTGPGQARAAAALLARFHTALDDLDHRFWPLGITLYDPPANLRALRSAVAGGTGHRLHGPVAAIAREIEAAADAAPRLGGLPVRVVHADPKFNNVLFEAAEGAGSERAVAWIDLDTVSRMPLWAELGDAWRSWCNRAGEDEPEAELDLGLYAAAAEGYRAGLGLELAAEELRSLAHGLEWIALELAARFAADALNESYFAWDPERFVSHGEHNLARARGQLSLAHQAQTTRSEREGLVAGS